MSDRPLLVRHFLAALAYRFRKTIEGIPPGFDALEAGHGIRTPLAIVHHINGVLGYANAVLRGAQADFWYHHPQLDWQGEVSEVHETLARIDSALASGGHFPPALLERLLQGPLSDAMTHVGQLALLRRIAGSPIRAENFYLADIRVGQTGEDQPAPVSPDPE